MTSLFPTFGSLLHRVKQLLATDISPVWRRFKDICEADNQRYQSELEAKGLDDFDVFGFGKF